MSHENRPRGPRESHLSEAPTGQMRAARALAVEAAGRTDKGQVRPGNEDAFGVEPPNSPQAQAQGTLLIVSDGMGGHAAGEVASQLAVETIQATYYRERGIPVAEAVRNAIARANSAIYDSAQHDAERSGMGCTIVTMVVRGSEVTVGHVGDSRGYLIRGGRAHQLTRDHSWVAMQVEEGILTPEQAEHHPNRSLLMRALGRQPSVEIDVGRHQLQDGDVLLLCSDGLTGVVNDAEIGEYASRYAPATAADHLVSLANQRGAPDNVTVVAAAITAPTGPLPVPDTARTVIVPADDARTPRLVQPIDDPWTGPTQRQPATARAAAGTPIVVARESRPAYGAGPGGSWHGRHHWLVVGLTTIGLTAALVFWMLLRPSPLGDPDPTRGPEATAAATAASAPGASTPAGTVTVPPPVATGLPGVAVPDATLAAVAPPVAATSLLPTATPLPTSTTAPAATPTSVSAIVPAVTQTLGAIAGPLGQVFATPAASPPAAPAIAPTWTPTPGLGGSDAPPASAAGPTDAGPTDAGPTDTDGAPANPGAGDAAVTEPPAPDAPAPAEPAPPPAPQPAPRTVPVATRPSLPFLPRGR